MPTFYLFQASDDSITAVATEALPYCRISDDLGEPIADGVPVPEIIAAALIREHGGKVVQA